MLIHKKVLSLKDVLNKTTFMVLLDNVLIVTPEKCSATDGSILVEVRKTDNLPLEDEYPITIEGKDDRVCIVKESIKDIEKLIPKKPAEDIYNFILIKKQDNDTIAIGIADEKNPDGSCLKLKTPHVTIPDIDSVYPDKKDYEVVFSLSLELLEKLVKVFKNINKGNKNHFTPITIHASSNKEIPILFETKTKDGFEVTALIAQYNNK